jgi:Fur family ferric uptake transcriptional regulator
MGRSHAHPHADCQHADWAALAGQELARAGYRRGGARQAVVDLLAGQSCALSALDIEDALRGAERQVGRASVYRVLDELEQLKLVQRLQVGQGIARYEPLHPGGDHHHHHLVCDSCGDMTPFADEELERTLGRVAERVAFEVADHEIVLHGTCGRCRAAGQRATRPSAATPATAT